MELLQSLTDYLIKNGVDSKKLESWAEDGRLMFGTHSKEQGFEVQYVCNFEMSSITHEPKKVFALVVSWLNDKIPDRDQKGLPDPLFFSQRLDGNEYDIGIRLEFIEQYEYVHDQDGDWEIEGQRMSLKSEYSVGIESDVSPEELEIFDGHTQDQGLEN